jgi:RNase H
MGAGITFTSIRPNQQHYLHMLPNYHHASARRLAILSKSRTFCNIPSPSRLRTTSRPGYQTDSQAAIHGINNYITPHMSIRNKLKLTNHHILEFISIELNPFDHKSTFLKVPAHTGLIFNEQADQLAKTGLDLRTPELFDTQSLRGPQHQYIYAHRDGDILG